MGAARAQAAGYRHASVGYAELQQPGTLASCIKRESRLALRQNGSVHPALKQAEPARSLVPNACARRAPHAVGHVGYAPADLRP